MGKGSNAREQCDRELEDYQFASVEQRDNPLVVSASLENRVALPTNQIYCNSALCAWAVLYQLRTICCASLLLLDNSSSAPGVEGRGRDVPLGFTGLAGGDSLDISLGKAEVEVRSWGLSANSERLI
jgi:hypothetical protein